MMLNICSIAALEAYARQIEKLVTQWPKCWGLVYLADDAARAERLEKVRRRLTIESAQGRQVPRDWDPTRPWSCVFIVLAQDMEYWAEKVHHPAAAWSATGGRGSPVVASEAAVLEVLQGPRRPEGFEHRDGGNGCSWRSKESAVEQRQAFGKEAQVGS